MEEKSYVNSAAAQQMSKDRPDTELDRVAYMAERAERIAHIVDNFLERFEPTPSAQVGNGSPVPSGHAGQLRRLNSALDTLENLTERLSVIG